MSNPEVRQKGGKNVCHGVIGIDEVGRGPLAGPVTVCAVFVKDVDRLKKEVFLNTIRDSKKLSKTSRGNIYQTIRYKRYLDTEFVYELSSRSAAYIDRHGISRALRSCTLSCVRGLSRKGIDISKIQINLDAGLMVPMENLKQSSYVKGDERFAEIALASIIAKVMRDKHMERLAKTHKEYDWENNAGYGTLAHRKAIEKYGITKYHRTTYLKAFTLFGKTE